MHYVPINICQTKTAAVRSLMALQTEIRYILRVHA